MKLVFFSGSPLAYTLLASILEPVMFTPLILPLASTLNVLDAFLITVPVIVPPLKSPIFAEMAAKFSTLILSAVTAFACIILRAITLSSNTVCPVTCNSLPSILVPAGVRLIRLTISRPSRLLIACVTFNSSPLDI